MYLLSAPSVTVVEPVGAGGAFALQVAGGRGPLSDRREQGALLALSPSEWKERAR